MKANSPLSGRPTRVLLISSTEITRAALRLLLETSSRVRVVGEADSCAAALGAVRLRPHVIVLEHEPGPADDIEVLPQVIQSAKESGVLILTGAREPEAHCAIVRLGVMGLVRKSDPVENLFRAIERIRSGEVWLERALMAGILAYLAQRERQSADPGNPPPMATLTVREREVVQLVGQAMNNRQIAQRMFISETTVRHHLTSVFEKLGVSSRLELVKLAYCSGFAKP
jgi:DNA-binding NarL/FixJ family response regulator